MSFRRSIVIRAAQLLVLAASLLCGQASTPTVPQQFTPNSLSEARFKKEYVVVPGDQLDIVVRRVPEASRSLVVRGDGQITLPLAGDIVVSGLTTREINKKVEELLSKRLVSPEVTVIAAQSHQPMVYVGGEVNIPSAQALRTSATAAQALSLAGGLKKSAAGRDITIFRLNEDGKLESVRLDVKGRGQRSVYQALSTTRLFPDDIIFVPENGRSIMTRFIDDFLNRPLQGTNAILGTYVNFRLVQILNKQVQ